MNDIFPKDFLWGASTSSHQVEGDNFNNDWWAWEQTGATEPSRKACDHYNLFKDDFALAKELGHNCHRLGIEWSRVEKIEGKWDEKEWDHYRSVINSLLELGIEPFVTLNHFTIPTWLSEQDGWLNDRSIEFFSRFAVKAVEELGNKVQYWILFNEPHMLAFISYFYGAWTPCVKDPQKAFTVIKNMIKSHALASLWIRRYMKTGPENIKTPKIGIAKAVAAFHPDSPFSIPDRMAAHNRNLAHNHCLINSLIKGEILMPGIKREKLAADNTLDFIGLNYYYRQFIKKRKGFVRDPLGEAEPPGSNTKCGDITDMGWEIYPKGIYEVAKNFHRYNLPLYITENGLAIDDDTIRQKFIKDHLYYILKAINEGIPVKGYFHWSLLDNFEWAEGYSKRFGLIDIDYSSQKRTIRDSARYYSSVITSGKI